jgi:thiopurine S-methyltransferase
MEPEFWHTRWRENRIGFHEGRPNTLLGRHHRVLGERRRVLVPLAGKALDVAYLSGLGHQVVAIELVDDAVRAFFDERGIAPQIDTVGAFVRYRAGSLVFLSGDYFAATPAEVGNVNAVYDRAALIALPEAMRGPYLAHSRALVEAGCVASGQVATGLFVTLEYDAALRPSPPPPHAVFPDELQRGLARDGWSLTLLEELDGRTEGQLAAGVAPTTEKAWALRGS